MNLSVKAQYNLSEPVRPQDITVSDKDNHLFNNFRQRRSPFSARVPWAPVTRLRVLCSQDQELTTYPFPTSSAGHWRCHKSATFSQRETASTGQVPLGSSMSGAGGGFWELALTAAGPGPLSTADSGGPAARPRPGSDGVPGLLVPGNTLWGCGSPKKSVMGLWARSVVWQEWAYTMWESASA